MSPASTCQFRTALAQDVDAALPLIYSAGPQALDYGFACQEKHALGFMRYAFTQGVGFLGCANHTVALLQGQVVGIAAAYGLADYVRMTPQHLWQLWRFYPATRFADLLLRSVRLQSVMPPPANGVHYVAHFGVREDCQGQGGTKPAQPARAPTPGTMGARMTAPDK